MCQKTAENLGILEMPNDKIVESKSWNSGFRILDFNDHKNDSNEYNAIYCYTDGSKINNGSGCGFQIRKENQPLYDYQEHLGKSTTVFQAEVVAIARGAHYLMRRYNQNIIFRSDSQSAILAIGSTYVKSALVKECVEILNNLSKRNKVTLQWIKAHVGHPGNEAADVNAKAGAQELGSGMEPFLPVPFSHKKSILEAHFKKQWQKRWDENPKFAEQTKLWFKRITPKLNPFLKKGNRLEVGKLVQFITGHCNLLKHQFRICKSSESKCRLCETKKETPWHLATECQRLSGTREKYFHGPILQSFAWSYQSLLSFCKETSIWSFLDRQE